MNFGDDDSNCRCIKEGGDDVDNGGRRCEDCGGSGSEDCRTSGGSEDSDGRARGDLGGCTVLATAAV